MAGETRDVIHGTAAEALLNFREPERAKHVVQKGENLHTILPKEFPDLTWLQRPTREQSLAAIGLIAMLNPAIEKNPSLLKPGQELTLPTAGELHFEAVGKPALKKNLDELSARGQRILDNLRNMRGESTEALKFFADVVGMGFMTGATLDAFAKWPGPNPMVDNATGAPVPMLGGFEDTSKAGVGGNTRKR